MITPRRQQGFLLIAAVVLIIIVAVLALAVNFRFARNVSASTDHLTAKQAFYLAASGLQRGIRQWSLDNSYTGEANVGFAQGTFSITTFDTDFAGNPLAPGFKRIRSVGQTAASSGTAQRAVQAIINASGASPNLLTNPNFNADANGWTWSPAGNVSFDGTIGNPSGSLRVAKTRGGPPLTRNIIQDLASPVTTTVATDFTLQVDFRMSSGNGRLRLFLRDDLGGTYSSNRLTVSGGWSTAVRSATVPAGRTIVRVELEVRLTGGPKTMWVDNFSLTYPSGVSIVAWQEDFA